MTGVDSGRAPQLLSVLQLLQLLAAAAAGDGAQFRTAPVSRVTTSTVSTIWSLSTTPPPSTTGDPHMLQCCTSTIFACILIIDYGRFLAYAILGPFIQFFMIPSCELDIVYTKKLQRQREIVVKM